MSKLRAAVRFRCATHPEFTSQVELAEHLGISESQMSRVLQNRRRRLSGVQQQRLADFLEMPIAQLNELLVADEAESIDEMSVEMLKASIAEQENIQTEQSARLTDLLTRIEQLENANDELARIVREQEANDVK